MAQPAAAGRLTASSSSSSSSSEGTAPLPSSVRSNPFLRHRRSRTSWEERHALGTPARSQSTSSLLGCNVSGGNAQARPVGHDLAALIDFLNNHPPPADNLMSMPYCAGERGRWARIKKMGRRSKSVPRAPQQIRLPDSAVSGITIGGHRHIAISIPLEASPLAPVLASQHPVSPQQDPPVGAPSNASARPWVDKGVTVLRSVTQASGPAPRCTSRPMSPRSGSTRPRSQQARYPASAGLRSNGSSSGKPFDYIGALPTRFDAPFLDDMSAPWNRAPSRGDVSLAGHGRQPPRPLQQSACPARSSSMAANRRIHQPASIDGLICQGRWRNAASGGAGDVTLETKAPARDADKSTPVPSSEAVATAKGQDDQGPGLTVMSDNPLVSCRDNSASSAPGTPKSRRDIVRDKKRRDMERVRSAKQKQQTHATAHVANEDAAKAGHDGGPGHVLTLSTMMVVANVEPCPSLEPPTRAPSAPSPELLLPSDAGMPSPPLSACGSPGPEPHSASDRTSLMRRREWRATRQQGRAGRAGRAPEPAAASAPVDGAASGRDTEAPGPGADGHEQRLRDMERRLRRLERNGDVWLRALVPILASVNREPRDWASDEDAASDSALRRRASRRHASLLLERLAEHHDDDDEGWSDSPDEDVSGLGAIEPLMRELAGEARRRQRQRHKTAQALGVGSEGLDI